MSSVTGRIKEVKQPRGGYINPKSFTVTQLSTDTLLSDVENIHPSLVGLAVDYLTRFMLGASVEDAFKVSLMGVQVARRAVLDVLYDTKLDELANITGLDDLSIVKACKLVSFDIWVRNLRGAFTAKLYTDVNPDKATIDNIRVMVERSLEFFKEYGPIKADGFTFGDGYTRTVSTGDGDFLTADTLWDFKVSKNKPTSVNTLQLLMYWIMGQHSGLSIFDGVSFIGIYNPRLNCVYRMDIKDVPEEVINQVKIDVIGYADTTV